MTDSALAYIALLALLIINLAVTNTLVRSTESIRRKLLFFVATWIFPFGGAVLMFMYSRGSPVSPYPIGNGNEPSPPGSNVP